MIKRMIALSIFSCVCISTMLGSYKIHLSSAWYPAKKADLLDVLKEHEQYAQQYYDMHLNPLKIRAIISPHAGYEYSGSVAAAAYRLLPNLFFKRVIILAPSHHEYFKGVGLPNKEYTSYKNVLGSLELDTKVLQALSLETSLCSYQDHAHELDHAVNVQIPFIQYFCGKQCLLVPLLIGDISVEQAKAIATLLRSYIDDQTLVVVSSDFTHYGKRFSYEPFKEMKHISDHICQLDSSVVAQIQAQNLQGFDHVLQKTKATVCGRNPLKVLLALIQEKALGDVESYVVGYDTSASELESSEHSVSYVSCVFSNELQKELSLPDHLTGYEKGLLLTIARDHLETVVGQPHGKATEFTVPGLLTKTLSELRGVFVTLYKIGRDGYKQLRGCVGTIFPVKPLYEGVYDMVAKAALHDNRFSPVGIQELPYLDISISVLTDLKMVTSYRDIDIGHDGVVLQDKDHSAVYLPYVATEQGWNKDQMLSSLSQKAGLPASAWKGADVQFKTFQSIDFSEDKDPLDVMYEGYKK